MARHRSTGLGAQKGWQGRVVRWLKVWSGTRMGILGVGRKPWAGLKGLYGTGLQHSARTRLAFCTAWNCHVDDGGTHGADDIAGFSSHDGDDSWEQLRGARTSIFARADATATGVNAGCCCGQYQQRAIGRPATRHLHNNTHTLDM